MARAVHDLLEHAARSAPGDVAVVDRGGEVTYAELDRHADELAAALAEHGAGPGDRVAVALGKSVDAVAAQYAVMKAGAAYVPIDPHAPADRTARVLADCAPRCMVTASGVAAVAADPAAGPEDLAYILYTSGSTGQPKGVMVSHANALAFVDWTVEEFGVTGADRLASHAPFHFDLSVFDLYGAAAAGAAVVLAPPECAVFPRELRRFLDHERITVSYSVPSMLTQLALRGGLTPGDLPALRRVLFAGEVFPTKHLRRLMAQLPHARFANLYGPTETNVCTWYELDGPPEHDHDAVPIGVAVPGTQLAIVDGELSVRGPTVARGYWNDAARSAARFVDGGWYRTGDLVEQHPDGNLGYLGRRDRQVKSRGHRLELGDVEAAVYAHPAVVECAVVAVPDDLITTRLRAFVVVEGDVSGRELARFTADRLPRYMVPEAFDIRPCLPRTATGKTDVRALSGP